MRLRRGVSRPRPLLAARRSPSIPPPRGRGASSTHSHSLSGLRIRCVSDSEVWLVLRQGLRGGALAGVWHRSPSFPRRRGVLSQRLTLFSLHVGVSVGCPGGSVGAGGVFNVVDDEHWGPPANVDVMISIVILSIDLILLIVVSGLLMKPCHACLLPAPHRIVRAPRAPSGRGVGFVHPSSPAALEFVHPSSPARS